MAVQISKSGGIYIEISGDYSQLQQDLRAVRQLANTEGKIISDALGIAIDPKPLSDLTQSLMKVQSAGKAMAADFSSQEKALREWGQAVGIAAKDLDRYTAMQAKAFHHQAAKNFSSALRDIQFQTGASDREMRALAKSLGGTGNEFVRASKNTRNLCVDFTQMGIEAGKAALIFKGFSLPGEIAKAAMQFDSLQRSFNAIAGTQIGGADEMQFIRQEADRLGQDVFTLASNYKGLLAASKEAGISQELLRKAFSAVGEQATILGLSGDSVNRIFSAMSQMVGKGVVSMEEMRQQLGEQLPTAFAAAARGMGIEVSELIKRISGGQVKAEEMFRAFSVGFDNSGFAEAAKSARAEMTRFGNAVLEAQKAVGNSGFLQGLSESAKTLAESLKTDEMQTSLRGFGEILGSVTGLLGQGAAAAVKNHDAVITLAAAYTAFSIANSKVVAGLAGNLLPATARVSDAFKMQRLEILTAQTKMQGFAAVGTNAMKGLKAAGYSLLNVLGGQLGLALTAVAGAVAYFSLRQSESEKIAARYPEAAQKMHDSLLGIKEGAKQAGDELNNVARAMQTTKLESDTASLNKMRNEIKLFDVRSQSDWVRTGPLGEGIDRIAELQEAFRTTAISAQDFVRQVAAIQVELHDGGDSTEKFNAAIAKLLDKGILAATLEEAINGVTTSLKKAGDEAGKTEQAVEESFKEMAAKVEKAYASTKQGRADDLKKQRTEFEEYLKTLEKGTPIYKQTEAVIESLKKSQADMFKDGGGGGINKLESTLQRMTDRVVALKAELQDSEGESFAIKFKKELEDYDAQIAKSSGAMRERLAAAREEFAALGDLVIAKKTDEEDKKNLDVRVAFQKEYLEVMQSSEAGQIASIRARAEEYRQAGISAVQVAAWQKEMELQYSREAKDGVIRALKDYADEAGNMAKNIEDAMTGALSGMEDALTNFVLTGKLSFKDLADSIISDIARIIARQAVAGLVGGMFNLFGGGSAASSGQQTFGQAQAGGLFSGMPSFFKSAHGNVFSAPALSTYSNSMVAKPTIFPFAKGIGLMGEAGAEAIMPLKRMSSGDLGVRAEIGGARGGGVSVQPQFTINIENKTGSEVSASAQAAPNGNGGLNLNVVLEGQMRKSIASGAMDGALRGRFGLRPSTIGR